MSGGTIKPTHRHVKRGTEYQHIGTARIQSDVRLYDMDRVEIYRGAGEDDLWARRQVEFHDGRFEPIATPANATDTAGLVDELRTIGCHENGDARCTCGIGMDAADALSALRAENERLTAERDRQYDENVHRIAEQAKAEAERDRLQAELAQLRGRIIALPIFTLEDPEDAYGISSVDYIPRRETLAALTQTERTGETG